MDAYLSGEVNPGGEARYYFEYGTEPCGVSSAGPRPLKRVRS